MAKILVVDDEKMQCALIKMILQKEGHAVYTAANAVEGLKIFNSESIDFIITDVYMPGMDGVEMAKIIRTTHSEVPIVITSCKEEGKAKFKSISHRAATYFIEKPIMKMEILKIIEQFLNP